MLLPPLLIIGFAALAVLSYLGQQRARQARARALQAVAAHVNFAYRPDDREGIAEMPYALFRIGHSRQAGPIIEGTHNGLPLRLLDYEYVTGSGRSREVHRYTCGILTIPAACPALHLTHENALTRLEDHLGHHDVKLEYDDFNRRFVVDCEDQKFAFSMLDAQMMEWLLASDTFDRMEIIGPWVMVACRRLDPHMWLTMGTWLDLFHTHIPEVVYSTYPRQ